MVVTESRLVAGRCYGDSLSMFVGELEHRLHVGGGCCWGEKSEEFTVNSRLVNSSPVDSQQFLRSGIGSHMSNYPHSATPVPQQ